MAAFWMVGVFAIVVVMFCGAWIDKRSVRALMLVLGMVVIFFCLFGLFFMGADRDSRMGMPIGIESLETGKEYSIVSLVRCADMVSGEITNDRLEVILMVDDGEERFFSLNPAGLKGELPDMYSYHGWTLEVIRQSGFTLYTITPGPYSPDMGRG